jgi:hypothetical protein
MTAGQMLKELVEQGGYSRYYLAKLVPCAQSTLHHIFKAHETGRKPATKKDMHDRIEAVYNKLKNSQ